MAWKKGEVPLAVKRKIRATLKAKWAAKVETQKKRSQAQQARWAKLPVFADGTDITKDMSETFEANRREPIIAALKEEVSRIEAKRDDLLIAISVLQTWGVNGNGASK